MKYGLSAFTLTALIVLATGAAAVASPGWFRHSRALAGPAPNPGTIHAQSAGTKPVKETIRSETVCVVGGSMAAGWKDPHNDSYLKRAFTIRSRETNIRYHYISHAIPGFTADHLNTVEPGAYQRWLETSRPQVVVLSWGLENDMSSRYRDSIPTFTASIHTEIAQALRAHARVLVVTPPVTQLLATKDRGRVESFIHAEFRTANTFHNANVTDINVYGQMVHFLAVNHRTIRPYVGNSWHPNGAGHRLAGHLLARDLNHLFGNGPILYQAPGQASTQSKADRSAPI